MEDRMTAQQLKNSILQMAVQGKLVPQDPNDEPASVLLDRIRKEKEQLIKDGKIKKNKKESYIFRGADNLHYEQIGNEVKCIEDELPFEIPDNWQWISLGTVLEIARGGSPRPIKAFLTEKSNGVNWIKIGDTEKGGKYINQAREKIKPEGVSKSRLVHKGDFLLTNSMSFGRPYILNVDGCIHDGWLVLSDNFKAFDKDFLYYLLSSKFAYYQFCESVSGAVVKNLNSDKVAISRFAIPPINEQKRIANKIESLVPLIEKYEKFENELYELNSNIKGQLKKSILQYAIEGKLVQQDSNDEPASVLLERIREEKNKLIAEGKIKKDKNESIIYRRDNSYYEKFDKYERCINDQIPFEIPNNWCWERLSSFCIINMGSSPKGNSINSNGNEEYEFHQGKSYFSSKYLLKSNVYTSQPTKLCPSYSVLLCVRAPVGKVNIVDRSICIGRGLASIKPFLDFDFELLYYFLKTRERYFIDHSTGSTFKAITSNIVKECLLPVPPKNEQNRLLEAIKKIFSLLN